MNRLPGQNGPMPMSGNPETAFATGHDEGITALGELGVQNVIHKTEAAGSKGTTDEKHAVTDEKNLNDEIRHVAEDEEALSIGKGMTAQEKVENMEGDRALRASC